MAVEITVRNTAAPTLPAGRKEYDRSVFDQQSNILRLYFRELDKAIATARLNSVALSEEIEFNRRYAMVMS